MPKRKSPAEPKRKSPAELAPCDARVFRDIATRVRESIAKADVPDVEWLQACAEDALAVLQEALKQGNAELAAHWAFQLGKMVWTKAKAERALLRLKRYAHFGGSPEERRARSLAAWDRLLREEPLLSNAEREQKVKRLTGVAPRTLRDYLKKRLASPTCQR